MSGVQAVAVVAVNGRNQCALQVRAPDLMTAGVISSGLGKQPAAVKVSDGDACRANREVFQRFAEAELFQNPRTGGTDQ